MWSCRLHSLHASSIAVMLHHTSWPTTAQNPKMYTLSCAAFLISLFQKYSHYLNLTLRHQTWQLIAVKSGTKKVAITHSAGGPSEITIIPNRHFKQEPWLSQRGQWTHLSKIRCALHLAEIVLCISMGGTYFTPIKWLFLFFFSFSLGRCPFVPLLCLT